MILSLTQYGVQVFNTCHDTDGHFTALRRCFRARIKCGTEALANFLHASLELISLEEDDEYRFIHLISLWKSIEKDWTDYPAKYNSRVLTVTGSSSAASISAWRRNTLPRQARHNILSKAGRRSRRMTPATNLDTNAYLLLSLQGKVGITDGEWKYG